MNRYPLWKYLIVLVALVLGVLYSLPNLFGESPAVQVSPTKATIEVDTALLERVETALKQANVPYETIVLDPTGVKVRFPTPETQIRAKDVLQNALGDDYVIALNLLSRSPEWLSSIGALPMYLGLDLRGGVHFLLQVDMEAALDKAAERYVGDFRTLLRNERIAYLGVSLEGQSVQVRFKDEAERAKAESVLTRDYPDLTFDESERGKDFLLTARTAHPGVCTQAEHPDVA